ncbi:tRNA (adenosine(37)-N6)-threonylcarbamoyltransferase complex ATPase subunit type 1 TsaE [Arthrobacter sulfonylureivorans]|uniref:tRNA (adenosine(37)-N6)-threonylcarbamoyltransferase complex ATPase subunit type 1 TsaE n=1 Tax=Arthrobacter sulfonylureivorans TaxID=2486855 RepID=UPI0039E3EF4E
MTGGAGQPGAADVAREQPATPVWEREFHVGSAEETQALAARLGRILRAGDLVVLSGELGAGKTTFTQGLGEGLGVRPGIISPTFVLVRSHPSMNGGPDLVHVDAYRLESDGEIDDIDLENTLDEAVTVVEWGRGRVEHLSDSWLDISLVRPSGADVVNRPAEGAAGTSASTGVVLDFEDPDDGEPRLIRMAAYGPRWAAYIFA